MDSRWWFCALIAVAGLAGTSHAGTQRLLVVDAATITWSLPYTFGTHQGTIESMTGFAELDVKTLDLKSLELKLSLSSFRTGKSEMDCHLKEALGLDYSKSKFPKEHVCNSKHEIPLEGPDSVAFGDILFRSDGPQRVSPGKTQITGVWTVHGVTKPGQVEATVSTLNGSPTRYLVEGEHSLSLKDFGVVVKPFLFVKVQDQVKTHFRFILSP